MKEELKEMSKHIINTTEDFKKEDGTYTTDYLNNINTEYFKNTSYLMIDKWGNEIRPQGPEEISKVNYRDISYISKRNKNGFEDSLGLNTSDGTKSDLGKDTAWSRGYYNEVQRIFKTSWGIKHYK